MDKIQKVIKILKFYKSKPDVCIGASKVDQALGFTDSLKNNSGSTHSILKQLVSIRCLKKCKKSEGKGFKYKSKL